MRIFILWLGLVPLASFPSYAADVLDRFGSLEPGAATSPLEVLGLPDGRIAYALRSAEPGAPSRAVIRAGRTDGSPFETLMDYQLDSQRPAQAYGLAVGQDGDLWVSGAATDSVGVERCFVRVSHDQGKSWQTDLVFDRPSACLSIRFEPETGYVFAVGTLVTAGGANYAWMTLRRDAKSAAWSQVDLLSAEFQPAGVGGAVSVHLPSNGEIWVVGSTEGVDSKRNGLVRKSADHGATWKTVQFLDTPDEVRIFAIASDRFGGVYTCGFSKIVNANPGDFMIRKGNVFDNLWETVLDPTPDSGRANCNGVASSPDGVVVAVGVLRENARSASYRAMVSRDEGLTWAEGDYFEGVAGKASASRVEYFGGNFFISATEQNADGTATRALLRKLSL